VICKIYREREETKSEVTAEASLEGCDGKPTISVAYELRN